MTDKPERVARFRIHTVRLDEDPKFDWAKVLSVLEGGHDEISPERKESMLHFIQKMHPDLIISQEASSYVHPPAESITVMVWMTVPTDEAWAVIMAEAEAELASLKSKKAMQE